MKHINNFTYSGSCITLVGSVARVVVTYLKAAVSF